MASGQIWKCQRTPTQEWPRRSVSATLTANEFSVSAADPLYRPHAGLLLRQPSLTSSALHLSPATALLFALIHTLVQNPGDNEHKERIVEEYAWLWEQFTQGGLLDRAEEKPVLDVSSAHDLFLRPPNS